MLGSSPENLLRLSLTRSLMFIRIQFWIKPFPILFARVIRNLALCWHSTLISRISKLMITAGLALAKLKILTKSFFLVSRRLKKMSIRLWDTVRVINYQFLSKLITWFLNHYAAEVFSLALMRKVGSKLINLAFFWRRICDWENLFRTNSLTKNLYPRDWACYISKL